jgi:hypothetical protein
MRVAELLRSLLDVVDRAEVIDAVPQARNDVQNFADPSEVPSNNIEDPHDLYLPPLQMKLELLKKAVGVENVYDDGSDADQENYKEDDEYVGDPGSQQSTNFESELAKIKKSAGINAGVLQELTNDEPLDD